MLLEEKEMELDALKARSRGAHGVADGSPRTDLSSASSGGMAPGGTAAYRVGVNSARGAAGRTGRVGSLSEIEPADGFGSSGAHGLGPGSPNARTQPSTAAAPSPGGAPGAQQQVSS